MCSSPSVPSVTPAQTPAVAPTPNEPSDTIEVGSARKKEEQSNNRYGGVNLRISRPGDATLGGLSGTGASQGQTGLSINS